MHRLDGRVAVVLGAGRGIGEASARRLASEGAAVVVGDVDGERAGRVAAAIEADGGRAVGRAVDVRVRAEVVAAVDTAQTEFGRFDVLHNNVGLGLPARLEDTGEATIRELLDLNVVGMLHSIAVAAPVLRDAGGGSIVVTGSVAARWGMSFQVLYAATKGAVDAMVRAAAMEYAPAVRVNCVSPGVVAKARDARAEVWNPEVIERMEQEAIRTVPLARMARPEDIAAAVAFLASDDAAYVTGETITVSGGWSVGQQARPEQVGLR